MRPIDADRLCENLKWMAAYQPNDKQNTILGVVSTIKNAPTVDIKTEVAREIFAEIKQGLDELSNTHRENSNYSGVVHTIQARGIVINLENKYTKE